jgi:hypothetical protein
MTFESQKLYLNSLVLAHFNYCSSILLLLTDNQFNELQKVINRFMRVILNKDFRFNRQQMLDSLNLLSVKQQVFANALCFIHKITKGLCPIYLAQEIFKRGDTHQHTTRGRNELGVRTCRKSSTQNSLFYRGVMIYNEFNRDLNLNNDSITTVREKAKLFVKTKFVLT